MTKKIFLLVVFALILSSKLQAKKVEGKILFENGTIDVTFDIPVDLFTKELLFESIQYRIKYVDSTGKNIILKPSDAKEIRFKYDFENVRMISMQNSLGLGHLLSKTDYIFLKIEIDNKLKLFKFYEKNTISSGGGTTGGSYTTERIILQKRNEELKMIRNSKFKKEMPEYFSDCPKLAEKIEKKEYQIDDMDIIVRYYNSTCK